MAKKASFWLAGLQTRKSLGILSLCYRPIILDPADPTHNVAKGYRWDIVAQRASQCLKQDCCYDDKENPIPGWKVKVNGSSPSWLPGAWSPEWDNCIVFTYLFLNRWCQQGIRVRQFEAWIHHSQVLWTWKIIQLPEPDSLFSNTCSPFLSSFHNLPENQLHAPNHSLHELSHGKSIQSAVLCQH